jgi:geranylgeranyl reductase family protein
MDQYDVIVVGAGPGGSTAAQYVARGGARALLIDADVFPRDKACGDLLPGTCLQIVRELGLSAELDRIGCCRARRVTFATERERLVLDARDFASVPRQRFDQLLFTAAQAQVETLQGARVDGLLTSGARVCGVRAIMADGRRVERTARFTVGADGYCSVVARAKRRRREPDRLAIAVRGYFAGIAIPRDEVHFYYLSECSPGYLWIFPVGDGLANVGLYLFSSDYRGLGKPLRERFEALIGSAPLAALFRSAEPVEPMLSWSLPLAGEREPLHGDGYVLVGDAAGLVDPFWGHGIDSAMASGRLAARAIGRALEGSAEDEAQALASYTEAVFAEFEPAWRARRTLRAQIRTLNALLGTTPLEHFRRWLGENGSSEITAVAS